MIVDISTDSFDSMILTSYGIAYTPYTKYDFPVNIVQVASGNDHILILTVDGNVYGIGDNMYGQIGLPNKQYAIPTLISNIHDIVQISCGSNHSMFLTSDGRVYGCGSNIDGELGIGNSKKYIQNPILISNMIDIASIACILFRSYFITKNGKVYICGRTQHNELEIGRDRNIYIPVIILYVDSVVQIAYGELYTLLLRSDGRVYKSEKGKYTIISDLYNIIQIACGSYHSIFLTADGCAYGYGTNVYGQLGLPNTKYETITYIPIDKKIISISSNSLITLFLASDGTVYGCGVNDNNLLHLEDKIIYRPTIIPIE